MEHQILEALGTLQDVIGHVIPEAELPRYLKMPKCTSPMPSLLDVKPSFKR